MESNPNKNNISSYDSDKNGREYYRKIANKEIYAVTESGDEIYVKHGRQQKYATDENQNPYYARKSNGSEFYAAKKGTQYFIQRNNRDIYAKENGKEIYPKTNLNEDIIANDNGKPYYAKDENGSEMYPKNEMGIEFMVDNMFAMDHGNNLKYPLNGQGQPTYIIDINTESEIYTFNSENKPVYGKNHCGDEVYAKNNIGDEFYAIDNNNIIYFAKDRNGRYYYAKGADNFIIYPMDSNNQYYISDENGSFDLLPKNVPYAKKGQKEIYPIKNINKHPTEMVINSYYAQNIFFKVYIYPKDAHGNEYIDETFGFDDTLGYPITSDDLIIVPNRENKPYFYDQDSNITHNDIKRLLYRPHSKGYDFLTNIKSTRTSSSPSTSYVTMPLAKKSILSNQYFYIIAGFIIIIIAILILFL